MIKRIVFIPLLLILFNITGKCQKHDSASFINLPEKLPAIIVNGDTMVEITLNELMVVGDRVFKSYEDAMRFYMLKRDVKIVYPVQYWPRQPSTNARKR